jgi:Arc/MetJ family transcription regulator
MRSTIEVDGDLMSEAQRAADDGTPQETVTEALRLRLRVRRQADVRRLRGACDWPGDLDRRRRARNLSRRPAGAAVPSQFG